MGDQSTCPSMPRQPHALIGEARIGLACRHRRDAELCTEVYACMSILGAPKMSQDDETCRQTLLITRLLALLAAILSQHILIGSTSPAPAMPGLESLAQPQ